MNETQFVGLVGTYGQLSTFPVSGGWAVETIVGNLLDQILPVLGGWQQSIQDKWNEWKQKMRNWFLSIQGISYIADLSTLEGYMLDAAQYAADEAEVELWGLDGLPAYPASNNDGPGEP